MKRTISILLITLCACAVSMPAFSWGQKGHRIIAQIAYDNLSNKAKKNVDRILATGENKQVKEAMIYWSNWPDEIKSDTIYPQSIKDGWHYQDFAGGLSDSVIVAALTDYPKEGGNLFRALDSLVNVLKNDKNQTHTLRFIVHISGDRYCPMHMAHMDDKGGNAVKMKWFGSNTNLHSVWDGKLIDSQGYSFTEYAQKLEREYAYKKKAIQQASDAELLLDTYHLTEAIYEYQTTWDGNTYHYIYHWREPMEYQLYVAGIRLAQLINNIYK